MESELPIMNNDTGSAGESGPTVIAGSHDINHEEKPTLQAGRKKTGVWPRRPFLRRSRPAHAPAPPQSYNVMRIAPIPWAPAPLSRDVPPGAPMLRVVVSKSGTAVHADATLVEMPEEPPRPPRRRSYARI